MNTDLSQTVYVKNFDINNNDNTVDLNYSIPTIGIQGRLNITQEEFNKAMTDSNGDDSFYEVRKLIVQTNIDRLTNLLKVN